MIMRGAPTNATFAPLNGRLAYTYVYPQRNRPKVGIVYAPGVEGEVYYASASYDWLGVKIGNQYGWVHTSDMQITPMPVFEAQGVLEVVGDMTEDTIEITPVAEAGNGIVEEAVAEAWDNITAQEVAAPKPKRKYNHKA
jgi:uncharacterized protein YraI